MSLPTLITTGTEQSPVFLNCGSSKSKLKKKSQPVRRSRSSASEHLMFLYYSFFCYACFVFRLSRPPVVKAGYVKGSTASARWKAAIFAAKTADRGCLHDYITSLTALFSLPNDLPTAPIVRGAKHANVRTLLSASHERIRKQRFEKRPSYTARSCDDTHRQTHPHAGISHLLLCRVSCTVESARRSREFTLTLIEGPPRRIYNDQ